MGGHPNSLVPNTNPFPTEREILRWKALAMQNVTDTYGPFTSALPAKKTAPVTLVGKIDALRSAEASVSEHTLSEESTARFRLVSFLLDALSTASAYGGRSYPASATTIASLSLLASRLERATRCMEAVGVPADMATAALRTLLEWIEMTTDASSGSSITIQSTKSSVPCVGSTPTTSSQSADVTESRRHTALPE